MNTKAFVWIGLSVGSFIGGMIPTFWGAGAFSFSSVISSSIGGIIGIYIGFKLGK
jgi:hypothetical protein